MHIRTLCKPLSCLCVLQQGTEETRGDQSSGSRRSRLKEGLSNLIGKGASKHQ